MAKVVRGKALVAKLRAQAGVRDAEALAAYLGRFKKARKAGMSTAKAKAAAGGGSSGGAKNGASGRRALKPEDITYGKPTSSGGTQEIDVKADRGEGYPQTVAKLRRRKGEKEWVIEYGGKSYRQPQSLAELKRKFAAKIAKDSEKGELPSGRPSRVTANTSAGPKPKARSFRDPNSISADELPLVIQATKYELSKDSTTGEERKQLEAYLRKLEARRRNIK